MFIDTPVIPGVALERRATFPDEISEIGYVPLLWRAGRVFWSLRSIKIRFPMGRQS